MTERPDPYKVLQVDPEADPEVVQAAYRRLARKYHPDVAPGPEAADRMAAINRAWEVLRDPVRRAHLDRVRAAAGARSPAGTETAAASNPSRTWPGSPARTDDPAAPPPPGNPSGSVLNFGRYAGWSLGEIARHDLEYVEWLDRAPIGRTYREEVDAILRRTGRRRSPDQDAGDRRGLFRRR